MSRQRLFNILLVFGAIGWMVSVVGVLLPWPTVLAGLKGLGANAIAYDPMLDYWLRMTAGAFTMIGVLFLLPLLWPQRFDSLVPVLAWLMIAEGAVLLVHGLRLGLSPFPFYGDTAFCLAVGIGLLLLRRR